MTTPPNCQCFWGQKILGLQRHARPGDTSNDTWRGPLTPGCTRLEVRLTPKTLGIDAGFTPAITSLDGRHSYFKYNNPEPEQAPIP
jgi:hypothetical protein